MSTPSSSPAPPLRASDDQLGGDPAPSLLADYVTALGDDVLVAAQRMGEWIAAAPQIEEDIALGNLALDLLGQARALLTYAGSLHDPVRTEDDLAYFRDEREFRNVQLVERRWGRDRKDFAVAVVRLLILSTYLHALWSELTDSTDETIAAVAAKAVKEVAYHRDHASLWVVRLGDGTEESHRRIEAALEEEWRYVDELFEGSYVPASLLEHGVAVDPATLRPAFDEWVSAVLAEATLAVPEVAPAVTGGRRGVHTQSMGYLLAEMQHLARSHPGATW